MTERAEAASDGAQSDSGAGAPAPVEAIRSWLIARVAHLAELAPARIDPRETFSAYGLTSVEAVTLSGELEDWLGLRLPPTLALEYPTIETLAEHLGGRVCGHDPRPLA